MFLTTDSCKIIEYIVTFSEVRAGLDSTIWNLGCNYMDVNFTLGYQLCTYLYASLVVRCLLVCSFH